MGSLRRHALTGAVVAAFCAACAPASLADDPPAKLTPPENGKVTRSLGEDRAPRTITLLFDASAPLTTAPAVAVDDPHTAKGAVFNGTVAATSELVGPRAVKVPLVVDPADNVQTATYTVGVRLRGTEIMNTDLPVAVSVTRSPSETGAWALALLALAIGIAVGSALRWLSNTGSKLHDLLARCEVLTSSLAGYGRIPDGLKRDVAALRLKLLEGDVPAAETALNSIDATLPNALKAVDALDRSRSDLANEERQTDLMQPDDGLRSHLQTAFQTAFERLDAALESVWPNPDDKKDERAQLVSQLAEFGAFLGHYRLPATRVAEQAVFDRALRAYERGDYAEAGEAWKAEQPAAASAESTPEEEPKVPKVPKAGRLSSWTWWAARHAPFLIGVLTAVAIALVGLLTAFDINTMFLTNDFGDFLKLVGWGFGSALVGMTATQLAAKAGGPTG